MVRKLSFFIHMIIFEEPIINAYDNIKPRIQLSDFFSISVTDLNHC